MEPSRQFKGNNGMKCQECNIAEATIHVKEVRNEKVSDIHMCDKCAREKGYHSLVDKGKLSLTNQLVWMAEKLLPESGNHVGAVQCEDCGLKYSEFTKTGRLGCPDCYDAFAGKLKVILRRTHGAIRHGGKAPGKEGEQFERRRHIQQLYEDLERAIEREEYEKAAVVRDEIRKLEAMTEPEQEIPVGTRSGGSDDSDLCGAEGDK
jgi:protein arginine kinase activator